MLLVLGQPGIGKSTLVTWITAKFYDDIEDILVYKFADDLRTVDWTKHNISMEILDCLDLSYYDLEGKTLIIDGFDEVSIGVNRREILDNLYEELIYKKNINNFSLIITCRENYIKGFERIKCKNIILQPWDEIQIKSFCDIFQEKTRNIISDNTIAKLFENKKILGVPLILYMTLSLNISIDQESSIVDVYDKIFALEGGVYDRCIGNKKFADTHRISKIKGQIHQISREIALWVFENNPDVASIPQEEYKKICFDVKKKSGKENEEIDQDFLIGNYFKSVKHCEGTETEELYFVHRSIYEYFVSEYIFSSIQEAINISNEKLANVLGSLLKGNKLSIKILEFLKIKMSISKLNKEYDKINVAFQLMLKDGMIFYTGKCYKNVIDHEMNVFANMLEIIHFWDCDGLTFNFIFNYIKRNLNLKL